MSGRKQTPDQGNFSREQLLARLLRAIRTAAIQDLRPALESHPHALNTLEEISVILDHLTDWVGHGPSQASDAERRALLAAHAHAGFADQRLTPDFEDASPVAGALAALVERQVQCGDADTLSAFASRLAAVEQRVLEPEYERMATFDELEARKESSYIELTPVMIESYLSQHEKLPAGRVAALTKVPGGYSKDTYLISMESGTGYVIRRDLPFGPTPRSAAAEYELLARLVDLGFPAPRPLAAEFNGAFLGFPFLLVEKVSGRAKSSHEFGSDDPLFAPEIALELARLLGRLHSISLADLGFSGTDDPRAATQVMIDDLRRWWYQTRVHSSPICELAFAWLGRSIPTDTERLVLVHGDAGLHNVMVDNGKVTALLDWEFAHVGDPTEDLETARMWLGEELIGWTEFETAYLAAGGIPVNRNAALFYEVWRSLRNVVLSEASWHGFVTGAYPVAKTAFQGVFGRRMFLRLLCDVMQRVPW